MAERAGVGEAILIQIFQHSPNMVQFLKGVDLSDTSMKLIAFCSERITSTDQ
ncbi:hypothetical protein D3C75_1349450 [compost metagenome]